MVEMLREKLEALLLAQRLGDNETVRNLQIQIEEMYEFDLQSAYDYGYDEGFHDGRDEGYMDGINEPREI